MSYRPNGDFVQLANKTHPHVKENKALAIHLTIAIKTNRKYRQTGSHHCFVCNKCILKRHNHCFFLGKCAGHKNYRYYICFVIYTWLGTLFSLVINRHFFVFETSAFSLKTLCVLFTPWLAFAIGLVTLAEFVYTLTNMACLILFFLLIVYLVINMHLILQGQTWSEQARHIEMYKLASWRANIIEV